MLVTTALSDNRPPTRCGVVTLFLAAVDRELVRTRTKAERVHVERRRARTPRRWIKHVLLRHLPPREIGVRPASWVETLDRESKRKSTGEILHPGPAASSATARPCGDGSCSNRYPRSDGLWDPQCPNPKCVAARAAAETRRAKAHTARILGAGSHEDGAYLNGSPMHPAFKGGECRADSILEPAVRAYERVLKHAKGEKTTTDEPLRVTRALDAFRADAPMVVDLRTRPSRRTVKHDEVVNESWLELVQPSAKVAADEVPLFEAHDDLELVRKARERGYWNVRPKVA